MCEIYIIIKQIKKMQPNFSESGPMVVLRLPFLWAITHGHHAPLDVFSIQRFEKKGFPLCLKRPEQIGFFFDESRIDVNQNELCKTIHTCSDGSSDWLTSALVSERHQVNGILFPWSQTGLHKGSDGAGQLSSHPSIVVLGKKHRQSRCDETRVELCCTSFATLWHKPLLSAEIKNMANKLLLLY